MTWNWQQPEWPTFTWDASALLRAETQFVAHAGVQIGVSKHLSAQHLSEIRVELISEEATDTSAIEGEALDRDSVQSSIRKHLGLTTDRRRASPAEAGIAEMTVELFEQANQPLTEEVLFRWHRWVMNGRSDLADVGRYRTHAEPMQIVSGYVHAPKVHFEAPPSASLEREMDLFWAWLEQTSPDSPGRLPPLARAGIAHLWFESIHPFEDGNGRIGRAISEKLLAQGLPTPVVTGMSSTLLRHRKAYYRELERAHRHLEITDWLLWFAAKALEAQQQTLVQIEFVLAKARLMESVRSSINERQEKVLLRLFAAGPEGFKGGLSAANYMSIAHTPPATTTRDLAALVETGALTRTGAGKSTRYHLPIDVAPVHAIEPKDVAPTSR
ncbi:Fic family protein [Caulobacter segnis]|uniref:Fic family protein n=1 Tax=Caulobacter segnis TaxID=88688 RepID=UPI00240F0CBA|nr:Fic family protein [Caulobacter segnis]MDG2521310.1 Fic family protein [Caulobacter segnis]